MNDEMSILMVDSGTSHTILRDKKILETIPAMSTGLYYAIRSV